MATPAETPASAPAAAPGAEQSPAPAHPAEPQPASVPAQPEAPAAAPDTAAAQPAADPTSPLTDPLAALGSMWTGWMSTSAAPPASAQPATAPSEVTGETDQMAAAAAAANDWLAGAGKMWESAVKDVGSKVKSAVEVVDTAALGEQVAVIRQKSGRFVEDMSKSVQSMNLSLDQSELQKRAEVISSSTKDLLDKATQSLQQGHKEALEIFVDADPSAAGAGGDVKDGAGVKIVVAPWDKAALPESEHMYADALRQEMLKIVVDAIYSKKKRTDLFLSGVAEANRFEFDFDANSGMAMAALESDKNMRRLRAGLVPGKMKEDAFWNVYFYHVHRIRQALVANNGVMPEPATDDDDEDPAALFAEDDEDEELAALDSSGVKPAVHVPVEPAKEGKATNGTTDGKRNWDDEIDAIFDDDE